MEPTIYKPGAYKTPGVYKGTGGIYKGRDVYNDGATPPPGKVIFGGIEYEFTKINNLYWINSSLKNITSDYFETPFGRDVGLLYGYNVFSEITALLHDDWRIPQKNDFNDLIGGESAESTGYISEIDGGTNETGFSGRMIGFINNSGIYNNSGGYIWSDTYKDGVHNFNTAFNSSIIIANDSSRRTVTKLQIRLCKDV